MIEELGIWGHLITEHPNNESLAKYKYSSVLRFAEMLSSWESDPDTIDPSLPAFLNRISLITRDDLGDENVEDKVQLMTIHAAKGLEFEVVFLAAVEKDSIPHARALEEDERNIEEERRLFYVAITRARKKLFLSSCRRRRVMREIREREVSPFVDEIPETLVHLHEEELPVEQTEAASFFDSIKSRLTSK